MSTKLPLAVSKLTPKQLAEIIRDPSAVCIIGYKLSEDAGAPHFRDIINGVWSQKDARLNPFVSEENQQKLSDWFQSRQILCRNSANSDVYQSLGKLRQALGFSIATQCVDGVAQLNGVPVEYELFGNIFQTKCQSCGFEDRNGEAVEKQSTCKECGGRNFPNVSMFGWNPKLAIQVELVNKLRNAHLVWLIGADENMVPLTNSSDWQHPGLKCLRLEGSRIYLDDDKGSMLFANELAAYLNNNGVVGGEVEKLAKAKADEHVSFADGMKLIVHLIQQSTISTPVED